MKYATAIVFTLLIALCGCASQATGVVSQREPDTSAAWKRLQRELPGEWLEVGDYKGLTTTYRSVSRDSSMLETFGTQHAGANANRQTLSVYHPDGHGLMATHYCAQGNQARLRASQVTGTSVQFDFLDATNVGEGQSVLHQLTLALDGDTLERVEVYRDATGKDETTRYRFERQGSAHPVP